MTLMSERIFAENAYVNILYSSRVCVDFMNKACLLRLANAG